MIRIAAALCTLACVAACSRDAASSPTTATPAPEVATAAGATGPVVATVNGAPITQFELGVQLRAHPARKDTPPAEAQREALEELVRLELYAQKAVELGLDKDPAFLTEAARVEAQVRAARRTELARLYRFREVLEKAMPGADEVRAAFDANPKRFRSTVRVGQLVLKGRAGLEAARARLAAGESFEAVARSLLGTVPEGTRPWELPAMAWAEVPPSWWPALERLEPGQVSEPIAQPNDRFVVLQLLERGEGPEVNFEQVRPVLEAALKVERAEARRVETEQALRTAAKVEVMLPPAPPPPAPERDE